MNNLLNKRRAGILLHITSLPGAGELGDLGQDAYYFVDFLKNSGLTVWQTLPLGMTHEEGSPYACLSAHAGNPSLINIENLIKVGWLDVAGAGQNDGREFSKNNKSFLIRKAYRGFLKCAEEHDKADFAHFCRAKAYWLDDFALFIALRDEFDRQCWNLWPEPYKERDVRVIKEARKRLKDAIDCIKFEQYVFFRQWMELKAYANLRDVLLFGDIPIFVSYDSADVWANRDVFKLDDAGAMTVVAGVPPDYFSATGQRWGNPHYNWQTLIGNGFDWWLKRMETLLEQFDIIRIDHFRGFEAAWEIPADEETAINGKWVKAPGKQLLQAIQDEFGQIPLVAEDLGIITPEVEELRDEFNLPGMKILQFAFGSGPDNPYLPDHHEKNSIVYTGTHDNDTTVGWADKLGEHERHYVYEYLGFPSTTLNCALIQAAFRSVANLAVIPMQDILELGTEHRMNIPGTSHGNWLWRFQWEQLTSERAEKLAHWVELYDRK